MKHIRKQHKSQRNAPACPKCGPRPYVIVKGVALCGRCKQPLPNSYVAVPAFAFVRLAVA